MSSSAITLLPPVCPGNYRRSIRLSRHPHPASQQGKICLINVWLRHNKKKEKGKKICSCWEHHVKLSQACFYHLLPHFVTRNYWSVLEQWAAPLADIVGFKPSQRIESSNVLILRPNIIIDTSSNINHRKLYTVQSGNIIDSFTHFISIFQ